VCAPWSTIWSSNETPPVTIEADRGRRGPEEEKERAMTLSGNVQEGAWSVDVQTEAVDEGRYQSTIHVKHWTPEGQFEHTFRHGKTFSAEREAVLEGLREGMTWIELKMAHTIKM
jgi:hypothetical protein